MKQMIPAAVERAMKLKDVMLRAIAKRITWYRITTQVMPAMIKKPLMLALASMCNGDALKGAQHERCRI